ncbi:unnamed protein product [Aureobasidium vineae]|uniref:SHSP domain-containing protein n=1 Tax=Aureobasidium vineae TaxID=2773715 RepID=A0A9N8PGZ9_9PEZI|nr:unnamed protein product [Aureobasidium vineae]
MSNTRNMNQANNFWDFVASLQNNQGASPFAEGRGPAADFDPFQGQEFWAPWMSQRGRGPHHGHPHGHRHGREGHRPPPPPEHDGNVPPAPPVPHVDEPSRSPSPPTPPETPAEPQHHPHRGPSPHQHGPRHPHRGPPPHHGPHHHRGGHRGRGRGGHEHHNHGPRGPAPFPFDLNALAEAFAPALFGNNSPFTSAANPEAFTKEASKNATNNNNNNTNIGTFTPTIDLFSTPTSYILHTSLPGAKKPDIDITYSSTRNSITISGVIARPDVSETMMNCLITDERREVGLFEREVKLEEGVKVDEERIGAKLEDGVLRVVVPKVIQEEEEGWESVRKVELE